MRISVVRYYTKDSCLTQSKHCQGFDRDASVAIIVSASYEWNTT
jgi:hypothetical protein